MAFTLPQANRAMLGAWYRFRSVVDQDISVVAPTVDTLIVLNDLTADSLAASTAGQKIGALIEVECIEVSAGAYKWVANGIAVGHTYTVAT